LNKNKVAYHIRSRNNFKVFCFDKNVEKPVFWLFNKLNVGEFYHHPKIVKMNGVLCYVSGTKTFGKDGKLDFLILMLALVWCYKIGDFMDENIKPIEIKKH